MTPKLKDAYKLLHRGSLALAQVEANGIRVDVDYLEKTIKNTTKKVKGLEVELKEDKTWRVWRNRYGDRASLGSDTQLGCVLFEELGLECKVFTASRRYSTNKEALKDIKLPFVKKLFHMRKLEDTVATFLKGIQRETVDGFLHPMFNLNTAVSYRSSCNSPNAHNWPRRDEEQADLVRRCFISRPGWRLWELDFKGVEVAVNACYSRCPNLIKYVTDKRNDMHLDSSVDVFLLDKKRTTKKGSGKIRDLVKNRYVFPNFYGSYHCSTARDLWDGMVRDKLTVEGTDILLKDHLKKHGIKRLGACDPDSRPEPDTFEHHIAEADQIFWGPTRFFRHKQWKKELWETYQRQGYLDTFTGFRVQFGKGGPMARNDACNYPVQGSAFHCDLWTLIELQKWINKNKMRTKIVNEIHDSVIGDSPPEEVDDVMGKAKELVEKDIRKYWKWIIVPLEIEIDVAPIDGSWLDKKPYEIAA